MLKRCKWCGKEFETTRNNKIYCDEKCVLNHKRQLRKIKSKIQTVAKRNGFDVKNADKIIRAKLMIFKEGDVSRCPCDAQNPERYCGSYQCKKDTLTNGHCHCNLFHKRTPSE